MPPITREQLIEAIQELRYLADNARNKAIQTDLLEWRLRYLMRHIPMHGNYDHDSITPAAKWSFKCGKHEIDKFYSYRTDHKLIMGLECNIDFNEFVIIHPDSRREYVKGLDNIIKRLTEIHQ